MSQLNIYFAGSMRGGQQDVHIYYDIIQELKTYGHVLTEFVGDKMTAGTTVDSFAGKKPDKQIHDDDMAMLKNCDCIVAEVTQPSLGVGYEIGHAESMNKRVLCLYRPQENRLLSGMIRGAHNGTTFTVVDYKDVSEVPSILKEFFNSLK